MRVEYVGSESSNRVKEGLGGVEVGKVVLLKSNHCGIVENEL
jgi:hypothetical protein